MPDNSLSQATIGAVLELWGKFITAIVWPQCSPDLSPIKHLWASMKDGLFTLPFSETGSKKNLAPHDFDCID
ncbi:hypothetical protein HI914_00202 [Erysiphe necator]|nr:hypothetical protein HI914_00202 [Erysiphe necator]